MKTIHGDLITLALSGMFDVIIHGCNCDCLMGAGIAKSIRRSFPEAYQADQATQPGDDSKLGSFSYAECRRGDLQLIVVNAYTQLRPSGPGTLVQYDAVQAVMRAVKAAFSGKRIGYPKIGAGLARGDWSHIAAIIEHELAGEDHTLVEYEP